MFGDTDVEHGPTCVMHHKEDVEDAKGRGRDGKEVHGGQDLAVTAEESAPPLLRLGIGRALP